MFYLVETNLYPGSAAELYTPYRNTQDWCLQLFYILRGSESTKLSIISIGMQMFFQVYIFPIFYMLRRFCATLQDLSLDSGV